MDKYADAGTAFTLTADMTAGCFVEHGGPDRCSYSTQVRAQINNYGSAQQEIDGGVASADLQPHSVNEPQTFSLHLANNDTRLNYGVIYLSGDTQAFSQNALPVPENSTVTLSALGLLVLGLWRRRVHR